VQKIKNILDYKGIGEVSYIRSNRAKNLSIRINQQGKVRVTIPRFVSQNRAERFFLSKQQWVLKRLKGLSISDCSKSMPADGGTIQVRGRELQVRMLQGEENVEEAIWRVLRGEALDYLPDRVMKLSDEHGFNISGLKIRRMKTRWGSCTTKGSINLNCWLMMIPEYLSDYVILHELVHTRIPNHGERFWQELDGVTGGLSRQYRKELRDHQIMCFHGKTGDQ
jgi:predicted metal-dependent hydrolase